MSIFLVISTSEILHQKKYEEYVRKARPILERYGGTYLLQSDKIIASKDWESEKIVIITFASREQMDSCFQSPEYQEIVHLREESIRSRFVMVES